ncbi:MAG: DNA-3-methyladenine glycosylase [Terricaulis silvestris]
MKALRVGGTSDEKALSREELPLDPVALARFLIGVTLVRRLGRQVMTARIVETEAYVRGDPAGHGFNGLTKRNASLFEVRGQAYVYRIYGAWWCLNVSAGKAGEGVGVLIRAAEPLAGIEAMQRRRPGVAVRDLLRGPGRLCETLRVDGKLDGVDLVGADNALWLAQRRRPRAIGKSVRIGLSKAKDAVLRFYERGSPYLSGTKRLNT